VISIFLDKIHVFNAGTDTGYCYGQMSGIQIGSPINNNTYHNFLWTPSAGLNNPNLPKPIASPSITTIYTLTVSDALCPNNVSYVTVTAFLPPLVNAGSDTTINEGQTITLSATGGTTFWWQPEYNIKYINSSKPDVWPIITTNYNFVFC